MSKLETLKSLPTSSELRQNVAELGRMLDATARQVQSLEQLPSLVAEQVTEAMKGLDPILSMRQDVAQALEAFDQVTKAQRQTLEALGQELAASAAQSMERRASALDKSLQELASQVNSLQSSITTMQASAQRLQKLPGSLDSAAKSAAEDMRRSANELAHQAQRVRPSMWRVWGQMLASSALAALLVVGGQAGLNKPAPPSAEIQQRADQLSQLVRKSTPKERELLNQILSRPDK